MRQYGYSRRASAFRWAICAFSSSVRGVVQKGFCLLVADEGKVHAVEDTVYAQHLCTEGQLRVIKDAAGGHIDVLAEGIRNGAA